MFKLKKYLKSFAIYIIAIFALLLLQAVCDLSLPDYMSSIVNVGIQQKGIENSVPKVIRESQLNKLTNFMNEEDKNKIKKSYTLISKENISEKQYKNYLKKYPKLKYENIYELNITNKQDIKSLNNVMAKSEFIMLALNKSTKVHNKNQIIITKNRIEEKMKEMPKGMINQASTIFISNEYKQIGIDTNKLQIKYIIKSGLIMLGISFISMIAIVVVSLLAAKVAAGLSKKLRENVFKKVVGFSKLEIDKFSNSSLITRTTNDIQQVQRFTVMFLRIVFYAPILGIGGILKVINTNVSMGWIIAIAVALIVILVVGLFSIVIPRFKRIQKLVDKLNGVTREILTGIMVIRAFGNEKYQEKKFEKVNKDFTQNNLFVGKIMSLMMPCMFLIMNCITILIVFVSAHKIDSGLMKVGDMMAFIQYTMQIIMAFLMISMISIMFPRASVSAKRISEVLEQDISIKDIDNPKKPIEDKDELLEFKNVSFKYPGAQGYVLDNISFKAYKGETIAFIGSTGSGKSTLINLIPRFYDTTEGEILINGVNIKQLPQNLLRSKIGYVPQKAILFSGTIESNIKYGSENVSHNKVVEAATIAQCIEFINEKPEKFNTEISQGGGNVSGGQKQRLSIARAIVKDPEIFIFDDSFSALDFKTESALQNALKEKTKDKTVLIVAQRISTIINADKIIVMDEGKVVGLGTHKELMKECQVYKQIALSQLSKEELENE